MKRNNPGGIIFDLDGTLYLGDAVIPGAVETCAHLRQMGKRLVFVSNKPLESRQSYAQKLTRLGISASQDEVITSAYVLGVYLKVHAPNVRLFVIGEEYLKQELKNQGLRLVDEFDAASGHDVVHPDGIDAVVVSFDRTLNYRKLNIAYQALMRGAQFFATNSDKACPMPGGAIPDAGATIAALEHITGRKLELLAGKPSPIMLSVIAEQIHLEPESCLMVGDRLETDITMGKRAGMLTALVLTGITQREDLGNTQIEPDFVLESVSDLVSVIQG